MRFVFNRNWLSPSIFHPLIHARHPLRNAGSWLTAGVQPATIETLRNETIRTTQRCQAARELLWCEINLMFWYEKYVVKQLLWLSDYHMLQLKSIFLVLSWILSSEFMKHFTRVVCVCLWHTTAPVVVRICFCTCIATCVTCVAALPCTVEGRSASMLPFSQLLQVAVASCSSHFAFNAELLSLLLR
jgi:hypothetical protein